MEKNEQFIMSIIRIKCPKTSTSLSLLILLRIFENCPHPKVSLVDKIAYTFFGSLHDTTA